MSPSIWDKVDAAVVVVATNTSTPASGESVVRQSGRWAPWRWRIANTLATLVWFYAVCKVFIFDVDQFLFERLWPQGGWLVTYRFFVLIGVASVLALVFRRWVFFAWCAYFALFPIIVVVWWIPRAIYKSRSWVVLLAALNVVTTFVLDFKFSFVTKAAALICIALVLVNPLRQLTVVAGAALLVLLATTYVRTVAIVLRPSRFVSGQQSAIDKVVGSRALATAWGLAEDLKDPQIVKFSRDQITRFATAVSAAAVVHRFVYFWAYQLDTYRKGSMPYVFNLLSYIWLFVQTVLAFAFINLALYSGDSTAFTYTVPPSVFDFFHYTINVIVGGSISSLQPSSDVALALSDLIRLSGPLVYVTVIATFVLSLKQSRQDDQMKESIARIKARAKQFDSEFISQYEIPIEEAVKRLGHVPGAFIRVASWLSREMPQDFGT
jgi:hypothetical protein